MKRLRTFVAIEATDEIRASGETLIRRLSQTAANIRWVNIENIHLTVKFLDEVDEREIHQVCRQVGEAAASCEPFQLECRGAGAFPSVARPRTIWMGVEDTEGQLAQLQKRTDHALRELGFPREPRKFHGHLTLGRIRYNRHGSDELRKLLETEEQTQFGILPVDELVVFSSELGPGGPQYTALGRCPLGNTDASK